MASWRVTGDTPGQYEFDGAGNPVIGHVITFTTGAGSTGSVFVPDSHYNVDAVRVMVAAKADVADSVRQLAGDT